MSRKACRFALGPSPPRIDAARVVSLLKTTE
jgi:hypothetical protein